MSVTVPNAVVEEIAEWISVMRSSELEEMAAAHGEHVLGGDAADLVAAALTHFCVDYVSSQNAVGDAIDRVAALRWSAAPTAIKDWDAAYAADAGKDGHRGDAVALLIGFGEAVGRGEDGDALISSGVRRFLVHMKLEGAGDGDWGLNEQWARRAADYLSAPASARSAIDRPHPVGWNEV